MYNQTKSKRVLNKFDSEFEKAKTSISNNPLGYPYVENKKPIRQKYQWKYWYFFIVISNQILITRIWFEKELLFVEEAYSRVKKQRDSLLARKENYRSFIRVGTEELKKEKSWVLYHRI